MRRSSADLAGDVIPDVATSSSIDASVEAVSRPSDAAGPSDAATSRPLPPLPPPAPTLPAPTLLSPTLLAPPMPASQTSWIVETHFSVSVSSDVRKWKVRALHTRVNVRGAIACDTRTCTRLITLSGQSAVTERRTYSRSRVSTSQRDAQRSRPSFSTVPLIIHVLTRPLGGGGGSCDTGGGGGSDDADTFEESPRQLRRLLRRLLMRLLILPARLPARLLPLLPPPPLAVPAPAAPPASAESLAPMARTSWRLLMS